MARGILGMDDITKVTVRKAQERAEGMGLSVEDIVKAVRKARSG